MIRMEGLTGSMSDRGGSFADTAFLVQYCHCYLHIITSDPFNRFDMV